MKYKVGDRVKVKMRSSWENEIINQCQKNDCVFRIDRIKNCGNYNAYVFDKLKQYAWYDAEIDHEATEKLQAEDLQKFTIQDLNNGDVVRLRDKSLLMFMQNDREKVFYNQNGMSHAQYLSEDMKNTMYDKFDIVEVYRPLYLGSVKFVGRTDFNSHDDDFELIWTRQEPKKMTKSEIESELGYEIEITQG